MLPDIAAERACLVCDIHGKLNSWIYATSQNTGGNFYCPKCVETVNSKQETAAPLVPLTRGTVQEIIDALLDNENPQTRIGLAMRLKDTL